MYKKNCTYLTKHFIVCYSFIFFRLR